MYSLVQLFAFGLAVSTAANGFQVSTAGNVGLTRSVAVSMTFEILSFLPSTNQVIICRDKP